MQFHWVALLTFVCYLACVLGGLAYSLKLKEEINAKRAADQQLPYSLADYLKWPGLDQFWKDYSLIGHVKEHRQLFPQSSTVRTMILLWILAALFFAVTVATLFLR